MQVNVSFEHVIVKLKQVNVIFIQVIVRFKQVLVYAGKNKLNVRFMHLI